MNLINTELEKVIDYIETHLKDDKKDVLDNATLARIANCSEFHFIRVFKKFVGLTPADYIRKRRISEIVKRIGEIRPMSDIAFEYGFNSKENFTRAFKAEHNILPTEYKTVNCSLRLFEPFVFYPDKPSPLVAMKYIESFTLVAYAFDDDYPPDCWNRYNAEKCSDRLSGGEVSEDFGAMIWNTQKNRLDYYIGIPAEFAKGNLDNAVVLDISAGLYAVFETTPATQHDFVVTVQQTWKWIYSEWLPKSGYRRGTGYELESYTESSKKYSERIYIPLMKE